MRLTTVRVRPARRAKVQELEGYAASLAQLRYEGTALLSECVEVSVCGETVAVVRAEPHIEVIWQHPGFSVEEELMGVVASAVALIRAT